MLKSITITLHTWNPWNLIDEKCEKLSIFIAHFPFINIISIILSMVKINNKVKINIKFRLFLQIV